MIAAPGRPPRQCRWCGPQSQRISPWPPLPATSPPSTSTQHWTTSGSPGVDKFPMGAVMNKATTCSRTSGTAAYERCSSPEAPDEGHERVTIEHAWDHGEDPDAVVDAKPWKPPHQVPARRDGGGGRAATYSWVVSVEARPGRRRTAPMETPALTSSVAWAWRSRRRSISTPACVQQLCQPSVPRVRRGGVAALP